MKYSCESHGRGSRPQELRGAGWKTHVGGDKAAEAAGAFVERHQRESRTGLGEGMKAGDVTELAAARLTLAWPLYSGPTGSG